MCSLFSFLKVTTLTVSFKSVSITVQTAKQEEQLVYMQICNPETNGFVPWVLLSLILISQLPLVDVKAKSLSLAQ